MTKIKKGTGKIEFFANLNFIKDKYYNDGYVVATEMHRLLKEEKNITMSYKQFAIYFKEFIINQDERFLSSAVKKQEYKTTKKLENSEEKKPSEKTPKVKKIVVGADKKKPSFNPHIVEIKPEDIL